MKMSMNPFCEIAVEEAVRMKEKKHAEEVSCLNGVFFCPPNWTNCMLYAGGCCVCRTETSPRDS